MKNSVIMATLIVFGALVATPAMGIEPTPDEKKSDWLYEIRAGVSAHDVGGLWSGSSKEGGVDFNAELILKHPSFSFFSGTVFPNFGISINSRGDTSNLYLGLLWERKIMTGIFLNLGIGAAGHNGKLETTDEDKKALGSHVLFRIPVEIGYMLNERHRLSFLFVHLSNAYLASPNEGLDTLALRYGYRF
ncbi:acyloxyacyl hydrolase [Thermodesulfobacteriota bacterium]